MFASFFQGCLEKIGVWLRQNILLVAAAALGIAFVEVRKAVGCSLWEAGGTGLGTAALA